MQYAKCCLLLFGLFAFSWASACGKRSGNCKSQADCQPNEICYTGINKCIRIISTPDSGSPLPPDTSPPPPPDNNTTPPPCTSHECEIDQTRCTPSGWVSRCILLATNNCRTWSPATPCPNQQDCANNQCPGGNNCSNSCTANTTRCVGEQIQACQLQSDGCYTWSAPQPCPTGQVCTNQICQTK